MKKNNKKIISWFAVISFLSLYGCGFPSTTNKPIKPTELSYQSFIQVDSLYPFLTLWKGDDLCFNVKACHKVPTEDVLSFYGDSAKSFIAEDREYFHYHYHLPLTIVGIDWRVTKIDAYTVDDWDENHPAGSLINDLISVNYMYQNEWKFVPLSDFKYGDLMMSDYGLTLFGSQDSQWLCECCLAFSLTEYPPENKQGLDVITNGIGSRKVRFELYDVWDNVLKFDNYSEPTTNIPALYSNDII